MSIFKKYFCNNKHNIAILIDPDKHTPQSAAKTTLLIEQSNATVIFVGGSIVSNSVDEIIDAIKQHTNKPIILFPGSPQQISSKADAMLLLSLVSGRNPQYLIGDTVEAAIRIKKIGIETISTAYMLIDGGKCSSVQYVSNTMPIPYDKIDIAVSTALAATMLGMKTIYLEAGSGALNSVSTKMISAVKHECNVPLIVGGGIKTIQSITSAFDAGADFVVIGSAIEDNPNLLKDISSINL